MTPLPASDLRAVLDCAYALTEVPAAELPGAMLAGISRIVRFDDASYNELDLAAGDLRVEVFGALAPTAEQEAIFAERSLENPLVAHQARTGDPSPARLSDLISSRAFHQLPIYSLVYRGLGTEAQLACGLHVSDSELVALALNRYAGDFSDRDVAVLEVAGPLLGHVLKSSRLNPVARPPREGLSERQRQVMALLCDGATDVQIALSLRISERTVGKHLELSYRKLGVTNRTAAVSAWRRTAAR